MSNKEARLTQSVSLTVRNRTRKLDVEASVTLLDLLHEKLGLTGVEKGRDAIYPARKTNV
jgi:xanthine dehydrogenase YagT iron-sulfur-binding subunit